MRNRLIVFMILLAVVLSACQPAKQVVQVEATDLAFNTSSIEVVAGQPVQLVFKNSGAVEHDFVVEKIDAVDVMGNMSSEAHMDMGMGAKNYALHISALPGQSETLEFTPTKSGTYQFLCTVAGHKEAGMVGDLIVVDQK